MLLRLSIRFSSGEFGIGRFLTTAAPSAAFLSLSTSSVTALSVTGPPHLVNSICTSPADDAMVGILLVVSTTSTSTSCTSLSSPIFTAASTTAGDISAISSRTAITDSSSLQSDANSSTRDSVEVLSDCVFIRSCSLPMCSSLITP